MPRDPALFLARERLRPSTLTTRPAAPTLCPPSSPRSRRRRRTAAPRSCPSAPRRLTGRRAKGRTGTARARETARATGTGSRAGSRRSARRRAARTSFIEGWGPGPGGAAPEPRTGGRTFPNVAVTGHGKSPATSPSHNKVTFSSVPRTTHPLSPSIYKTGGSAMYDYDDYGGRQLPCVPGGAISRESSPWHAVMQRPPVRNGRRA